MQHRRTSSTIEDVVSSWPVYANVQAPKNGYVVMIFLMDLVLRNPSSDQQRTGWLRTMPLLRSRCNCFKIEINDYSNSSNNLRRNVERMFERSRGKLYAQKIGFSEFEMAWKKR